MTVYRYPIPVIRSGEIPPERAYLRRREILKLLGLGVTGLVTGCGSESAPSATPLSETAIPEGKQLAITRKGEYITDEKLTSYKDVTHYNNYYEFGTDKSD